MADLLLKDLVPGTKYIIQVRAKNANTVSAWSTQSSFQTTDDVTAPAPPSGLSWTVQGSAFVGTWIKPTLDGNGSALKDFKNYKMVLTSGSTHITYFVNQETFTLSFSENRAIFGTAQPVVQISLQSQDMIGNLSTAVTATTTNAAPATPTNLTLIGLPYTLQTNWDASTETDFDHFELYLGTTSGFTPGPTNLIYSGHGSAFAYQTTLGTTFYVKLRQLDVFGQASSYAIANAAADIPTTIDTTPPSTPTGVTVSSSTSTDGSSAIAVSWTAVTSTNLRNYVVRYSLDQITWQYINVPSAATSTNITNLLPNTSYYIAVAANSYVNTLSSYANAGTYPITTAQDTTAPSTPAAPTVTSNTQSVQVAHNMKNSGGSVNLESDTDYLEVHGSSTTGFTPNNSTLVGTIQSGGQGISVSAIFSFSVTNAVSNIFWKVIAVDRSKNKSAASTQTTALPGLVQGINIASATITDANINDLTANKITAGTGFVNNLTVNSTFTLGSSGHMRSSDYSAGTQGWSLDTTGLFIYEGNISAATLLLQDSNNICPAAFADFEFLSTYYHDASNAVNTTTSSADAGVKLQILNTGPFIGRQSLRIFNSTLTSPSTHKYFFAPSGLSSIGVNVLVNPGNYILSLRVKKNGSINQSMKLGIYTDTGIAVQTALIACNTSANYAQISGVLAVPSGAQKVKIYLEIGPDSANTGYDVLIDTVQLERQIGALTTPSPWTLPGQTAIDGGSIVTGSIQSSAASATISGQPAWSINTAGNMQIGDALIRGTLIIGSGSENSYVASNTYSAGVAGWIIKADGTVEFNSGTFRGQLDIGNTINSQTYDLNISNQSIITRATDPQTSGQTYALSGTSPTVWFKGFAQQKVSDPFGTWSIDTSAPIQAAMRLDASGFLQIINDPLALTDIFVTDSNYASTSNTAFINKYFSFASSYWGSNRKNPIAYNPPGKAINQNYAAGNFKDPAGGATAPKMSINSYTLSSADASSGIWYNTVAQSQVNSSGFYNFTSNNKVKTWFDAFANTGGASFYQTNSTVTNLSTTFAISTLQNAAGRRNINSLLLTASGATEPRTISFYGTTPTYSLTGLTAGQVLRISIWASCTINGSQMAGGFKFNNGSTVVGAFNYINLESTNTGGHLKGQPWHYLNQYVITVPAGATAAESHIQFTGLAAGNTVSITAISVGTASDDQDGTRFAETTLADNLEGYARITTAYQPYPDLYQFAFTAHNASANSNDWNGTTFPQNSYIKHEVKWQDSAKTLSTTLQQQAANFVFSGNPSTTSGGYSALINNSWGYASGNGYFIGSSGQVIVTPDLPVSDVASMQLNNNLATINLSVSGQTVGLLQMGTATSVLSYSSAGTLIGKLELGSAVSILQGATIHLIGNSGPGIFIGSSTIQLALNGTKFVTLQSGIDASANPVILQANAGWTTLTLGTGWAAGTGSDYFNGLRIRKDVSGRVHLEGRVTASGTISQAIATIPTGMTPNTQQVFLTFFTGNTTNKMLDLLIVPATAASNASKVLYGTDIPGATSVVAGTIIVSCSWPAEY